MSGIFNFNVEIRVIKSHRLRRYQKTVRSAFKKYKLFVKIYFARIANFTSQFTIGGDYLKKKIQFNWSRIVDANRHHEWCLWLFCNWTERSFSYDLMHELHKRFGIVKN